MAKKVLSIVIGTECTKVCEVSYRKNYKNKGIRVFRSISFPTPANTIEDGYIKDKAAFGEELRNQLRAAKFKSDKAIFSVASSKIANREVVLPPTKEKRIMDIIQTGASDYFPIDTKEYILSYSILEKNVSSRKNRVLQRKLEKKQKKLARQQENEYRKALKRKSKTEIIADNMELLETQSDQQLSTENNESIIQNNDEGNRKMKRQMRLSVFAVPSTLIRNYYNFASMMHFDIVAMDYTGNSSYQIIKRQAHRGTNVFIQLNEQDTLISILQDDVLVLQRNVGYGISTLTDAVMEQDYYKVNSQAEAMELLKNNNLINLDPQQTQMLQFDSSWSRGEVAAASEYIRAIGAPKLPGEGEELEARRYIIESLHYLTNSIARMLDYYKANHKNVEIDTIYLSGAGMAIKGIDNYFTSEIGMPHKKMDKLATVSSIKKAAAYRSNPSEFASCIGAVIKPVDFVPLEFIIKKQKRSAILATVIFTLACLAGSAGTVYVSYTDYQAAKQELNAVNKQNEALQPLSGAHEEYDKALAELEDLQKLEAMTGSRNDDITAIINELEKKLPSGSVIHSMQFTENGVNMNVTANDDSTGPNAIIAKTLIQLKNIDYFQSVDVSGISETEEDGLSKVTFTLSCTYK